MPACDPSAANLKLETSNFALRSEHGYSVNIYDGIAAKRPKSMRCQLRRKYDQKKIRNRNRKIDIEFGRLTFGTNSKVS